MLHFHQTNLTVNLFQWLTNVENDSVNGLIPWDKMDVNKAYFGIQQMHFNIKLKPSKTSRTEEVKTAMINHWHTKCYLLSKDILADIRPNCQFVKLIASTLIDFNKGFDFC